MKTHIHQIDHEDWDLFLWFAILSPIIGVILGLLGLFAFAR
jgi:hypothetical protein